MILVVFTPLKPVHPSSECAGRLHGSGGAWLRCNSLEWNNHSPRPASLSLQAFKPARGMPGKLPAFNPAGKLKLAGVQAGARQLRKLPAFNPACKLKLAGVQAGARHAGEAAGFQAGRQA